MKGEVIGILRNGPGGAILLGEENGWSKINLRGTVGYVATKYLRDEPTVAVDERIDMSWLEGLWQYGTGNNTTDKYPYILYSGLLLFSDGTFLEYSDMFNEGGFTGSGTFILEGCTLVLTKTMDYVNDRKTEETERILLYPERHGMQDHYKKRFATQQELDAFDPEEWSGSGVLLTTRQAFRKMGRK